MSRDCRGCQRRRVYAQGNFRALRRWKCVRHVDGVLDHCWRIHVRGCFNLLIEVSFREARMIRGNRYRNWKYWKIKSFPHLTFRFPLIGSCSLPKPMGPYIITRISPASISFKNIFRKAKTFNFIVDEPDSFTVNTSSITLNSKQVILKSTRDNFFFNPKINELKCFNSIPYAFPEYRR